jgi:hypothetical protein
MVHQGRGAPSKQQTITKMQQFDTLKREKLFRSPPKDSSAYPALAAAVDPHIESFNYILAKNGQLEEGIKDVRDPDKRIACKTCTDFVLDWHEDLHRRRSVCAARARTAAEQAATTHPRCLPRQARIAAHEQVCAQEPEHLPRRGA